MRDLPDLLFHEYDLHGTLQNNLQRARQEVDGIPEKDFLHANDEQIVEHVFSKVQVMPLELHEDAMEMDTQETQIDVSHDPHRVVFHRNRPCLIPGVKVMVSIPFSGDPLLWKCQPNPFALNPPRANIRAGRGNNGGGQIELVSTSPSDAVSDGSTLKHEIDKTVSSIRGYLDNMRTNVEAHNQNLRAHIQQCVAGRRQRLGQHADIAKVLNIPLKRKPGSPDISSFPIKRRIVKPLPAAPNTLPEPGIRDEDYNHILNVIRHAGRSFEATPRTFAIHDEEELRDIILAHLNGHYEGDATGETFRKHGKTDIRIEDQNRAAFVGECKVWRGAKELTQAVNQLLSYLTWRDCKAALLLFNRDVAGFSAIQEKVPDVLKQHPKCIRQISVTQPGEWRFLFYSADDEARQVTVHVFLLNLYVASEGRSER
jgi:hypothetical protein